jgi:hypothetical protein
LFDACLAGVKARRNNRNKSKILARIDYVCAVVKGSVELRGLAKNPNRAFVAQTLAGIYLPRAKPARTKIQCVTLGFMISPHSKR